MTGARRDRDRLRGEIDAVGSQLGKLAAGTEALRRRTEQLAALRAEAGDPTAAIARLERVLDFDRAVAHAARAVEQARAASNPVAHVLALDLLPADTFEALVDALPPLAFFDGDAEEGREARVPLRLAPVRSIVACSFLDAVARATAGRLVERLADDVAAYARTRWPSLPPFDEWHVDIAVIDSRLARRGGARAAAPAAPDREWDLVTGALSLEGGGDVKPNTLVASVGPSQAPADVMSYELRIGPNRDGRRTLSASLGKAG